MSYRPARHGCPRFRHLSAVSLCQCSGCAQCALHSGKHQATKTRQRSDKVDQTLSCYADAHWQSSVRHAVVGRTKWQPVRRKSKSVCHRSHTCCNERQLADIIDWRLASVVDDVCTNIRTYLPGSGSRSQSFHCDAEIEGFYTRRLWRARHWRCFTSRRPCFILSFLLSCSLHTPCFLQTPLLLLLRVDVHHDSLHLKGCSVAWSEIPICRHGLFPTELQAVAT